MRAAAKDECAAMQGAAKRMGRPKAAQLGLKPAREESVPKNSARPLHNDRLVNGALTPCVGFRTGPETLGFSPESKGNIVHYPLRVDLGETRRLITQRGASE